MQEKRKRQLEERLNKVRERKKLKAEDNNEDAAESIVPSDDEEGPNPEDIPLPPEMITEHERKRQEAAAKEKARASHVRPWDQGKKGKLFSTVLVMYFLQDQMIYKTK